ncbi:MAG: prephenate dehydrogenase [Coriobacteriia bacterium]
MTVVGTGLIGGSFAAACRALEPRPLVRGVDTDEAILGDAMEAGFVDEVATPDAALSRGWFTSGQDDLVVLATPIDAAAWWVGRLEEAGFTGVVTDVASTKSAIVRQAEATLSKARFIGGHPMAGSERSGVGAASAELFTGAYYVLTPTPSSDMDAYRRLHRLVASFGARVISVDPSVHDDAVAMISHIPHMVAAALTNLAASATDEGEFEILRLAAGGFKDMTRIAAGSPALWTGISLDNRKAILSGLDRLQALLAEYRALLDAEDSEGIERWLDRAAAVRRRLPAQWVPQTTALTELVIPVRDKPGVISEVTTAVGKRGCNIEDIEIDHESEDKASLRLVLTDEGDLDGLVDDLKTLGYEPESKPLEP